MKNNINILKIITLFSVLVFSTAIIAEDYEVACDGYDPQGNWVSCNDDSDDDSSFLDDAKEAWDKATNTDTWTE